MAERDILQSCKGSVLDKMFNGLQELKIIDNEVFLDRDGKTFSHLVNYLRNDRELMPEFYDQNEEKQFYKELEFWKVPLKYGKPPQFEQSQSYPKVVNITQMSATKLQNSPRQSKLFEDYNRVGNQKSLNETNSPAKEKWMELGPFHVRVNKNRL